LIKKSERNIYVSNTQNLKGMNVCTIVDGDILVGIYTSNGDIATIAASDGHVISFDLEQVNTTGKTSKGVKAIKLDNGVDVIDVIVQPKGRKKIYINGESVDINLQGRGGKGVKYSAPVTIEKV
jgi:DNA gyrase subunit A